MSAKSVPVPPAAPASPKSAKPAEPRKPLSKGGRIALSLFFVLFDLAAWYLLLPAINPQCPGFWFGILLIPGARGRSHRLHPHVFLRKIRVSPPTGGTGLCG